MDIKQLENAQEMKQAIKDELARKWCNKCKKYLKIGHTMQNHRKGFEHKTRLPSWTQAF